MKFPLAAATILILAAVGVAKIAYDFMRQEKCDVAVSYEFGISNQTVSADFSKLTQVFADKNRYKFLPSSLDGQLTLFGPTDKDRQIIIFNKANPGKIKVSFYDCREGGDGSATGEAWMQTIGKQFLKLGAT